MGIFNAFKKIMSGDVTPSVQPANNRTLSTGEILFLRYANGHDADTSTFAEHYKYNYGLDNYAYTLKKLVKQGYITVDVCDESLALYKINDLKTYLKEHNMSISGKKQDLIQRIINSSLDYQKHFSRKICRLTDEGRALVEQYERDRVKRLADLVARTIEYIRTGNTQNIVAEYASNKEPDKPFALSYDTEAVLSDISAIQEYRHLGHDTDRELAICIVSIMFKKTFKDTIQILSDIGYLDVSDSEIYTASTSVHCLQNIAEFKNAGVKKYKILSCGDGRTCSKCSKMNGKTFPISDTVIGKTLPPFCDSCRCIIVGDFE